MMGRMAVDERAVAVLASQQHGVWTDAQACELGATRRVIQVRLASGRWVREGPGVLSYPSHPDSWHRRLAVGWLSLGATAAVGGRAAAALHGFDGFRPGPLEFVVAEERHLPRPGLVVRRTCLLPEVDLVTVDGLVVTNATRTIIDLAGWASRRLVASAIDSAMRDRSTCEAILRARIAELRGRGRSGPPLLDEIMSDRPLGEGGDSWLERRFLELVDDAGLPRPLVQQVITGGAGFIGRVDFAWPDRNVVVEVNGYRWHSTKEHLLRDDRRRNQLQLAGHVVYPFWYDDVVNEPLNVLSVLRRLLAPPPMRSN